MMNRLVWLPCLLLGASHVAEAAWISPTAWTIYVEGATDGPPGPASFAKSLDATEPGELTLADGASSVGTDPFGAQDGTSSTADATASLTSESISFSSQVNFDHGTALGFSSAAAAKGEFHFEVSSIVDTHLELNATGSHRVVSATLWDATEQVVWQVIVPELDVGVDWNGAFLPAELPFRRAWTLAPGSYKLTVGHATVPLAGTGGPSTFSFSLVPEPAVPAVLWLVSMLAVPRAALACCMRKSP